MTALFPCARCGAPQEAINVTAYGDVEPRFVVGMPCNCPSPRCPFCATRLGSDGRCLSIDCFMVGEIIPMPVVS